MKTWMPFRLLLYLWGLTGCHRSSDPSLVGWSGSRGSRENGHPNAHFLFLNWSLCPVTHDISSLPWALTEIIKAQRQASRALTAPTPAPLALSPKSPGKQASLNTQAQSKRSPGCTLHEDKEHVCLGLVLPATGHWKQASTLVGWKRARDGREKCSPKARRRPQTSKFLLKNKNRQNEQTNKNFSVLFCSISFQKPPHRTWGKAETERGKLARLLPKFGSAADISVFFAGSFYLFIFLTAIWPPASFSKQKRGQEASSGFLTDCHQVESRWNRLSRCNRNVGLASVSHCFSFKNNEKKNVYVLKGQGSCYLLETCIKLFTDERM